MSIGVAALSNFLGALFQFASNVFTTVADAAQISGDPEVPTLVLLVSVWCWGSGHYVRGLVILLVAVFVDLVLKGFGVFFGEH